MSQKATAIFALEDGSVFKGRAFGAEKTVVGEAVFNTSMTGYQEVLTDPSYFGQIVAMTAVEIGNYGVNKADEESDGIKVAGFVVREISPVPSSWRSEMPLQEYLDSGDKRRRHARDYAQNPRRRRPESLPFHGGDFARGGCRPRPRVGRSRRG